MCTTIAGLRKHQASGAHKKTAKLTSDDRIRQAYSNEVHEGIAKVEDEMQREQTNITGHPDYVLPVGWALKKPPKKTQHDPKVKAYIQAIFDIGQTTKEKANATKVSQDLRSATDDNGNVLFQEKNWLTPNQIKNMFSTMAKKAKQPKGKRTFSQTDTTNSILTYL